MKMKTRLWRALEEWIGHEIPVSRRRDFPGPTMHGVITRKDKNRVGRKNPKTIPCVCDGSNAVRRITGAKEAAVGGSRFLALMSNGIVYLGEFDGSEVHLKHDLGRSAVGCEFRLKAPRHYEYTPNPDPKPTPSRGKRYRSRREQILVAAFG